VTLAAFQLAETDRFEGVEVTVTGAQDVVSLTLGNPPEILASSGEVSEELESIAVDELWPEIVDQEASVSITDENNDGLRYVSAAGCVDTTVCDTAVVAATESLLGKYLRARWIWIAGTALVVALAAAAATRGLVGRSLRPVDKMRAELEMITSTDLDKRVSTPPSGDELERLGEAMNATLSRLGSAVAANQRFVADAAHELRSPITGIRAALELESERNGDGILEDGIRELDRASRLIDDLLLLARGEGAGVGRRIEVDLDDLASEQARLMGTRFPELSFDRSISPVRVIGDPDALRRVVGNMLENACLHGAGRVRIALCTDGDDALCVVEDDGAGIRPEDRNRVFERFARLDESRARATGGSGLGLALVAEVARNHGGSVEVLDSSMGGARFECRIPRCPSARIAPPA
jgi:signal transduction histidine kinase